jgi:hypothetical protein
VIILFRIDSVSSILISTYNMYVLEVSDIIDTFTRNYIASVLNAQALKYVAFCSFSQLHIF